MRAIRTAFIGKRGGAYASLLAARGGGLRVQTAFSSRPPPLSRILFSCFFIDFVKGFLLKNGLRAGNPQGAGCSSLSHFAVLQYTQVRTEYSR